MAQVGTKIGPRWPQVGPKLAPTWPILAHVGPSWPKLAQVGPKLVQDSPKFMLAPSWPHDGPSSKVSPRLSKASTKALPLASKAQVFQDVHEGSASGMPTFDCSFGLFHPLAFDLEGCSFLVLLSACPVMAGLSKRFVQTFLSSGSCRQLLHGGSSFFVHCTKAL